MVGVFFLLVIYCCAEGTVKGNFQVDVFLQQGYDYLVQGMKDDALQVYRQGLSMDPHDRDLNIALAIALIGTDQYDAALDHILIAYDNNIEKAAKEVIMIGLDMKEILENSPKATQLYSAAKNRNLLFSIYQRPPGIFDISVLSKPWFDPNHFWFTEVLESKYEIIKNELLHLMESAWTMAGTRVGNSYDPQLVTGGPNPKWKEFVFFDKGSPINNNLKKCPETGKILSEMVEATSCLFGQIHFSLLTAGTRLKPHCGGSNYRLTAHLGLIIPTGDVGIRVETEKKKWDEGKVLVFDDSYEHEVWNNSEQDRVVLLINFWHPALSGERVAQIVDDALQGKLDLFDPSH